MALAGGPIAADTPPENQPTNWRTGIIGVLAGLAVGVTATFFWNHLKPKRETLTSSATEPLVGPLSPDETDRTDGKNLILMVEDDPDNRQALADCLKGEFRIETIDDAKQAPEAARRMNPDLIVSDMVVPGMVGGDELCRILKASVDTSHIPVVLLTALAQREYIIRGLEAGASDYITRPFDPDVLKARIRNLLADRQRLRQTMLEEHTDETDETEYASPLDREFMERVRETIEREMDNSELSVNDFCRMLNMSRTSVYNKIKALTGQGPNDYIRILRLNRAQELLQSRRHTVGEVSVMVGFSDPKYFSTCFKKQFGISPSKVNEEPKVKS